MGISLQKGGNVNLSKTDPHLNNVLLGLGWEARSTNGNDFDLDASLFLVGENGKVRGDHDFIFYGQLKSPCGSIEHTGDNRTGAGDGDDESIRVDLSRVPQTVATLVFTVNSFTGQDFSQIANAFVRLIDESNETEIARYDLTGTGSHTAQIMAKVSRDGQGWSMTALGNAASGRTFHDLLPAIAGFL